MYEANDELKLAKYCSFSCTCSIFVHKHTVNTRFLSVTAENARNLDHSSQFTDKLCIPKLKLTIFRTQ